MNILLLFEPIIVDVGFFRWYHALLERLEVKKLSLNKYNLCFIM